MQSYPVNCVKIIKVTIVTNLGGTTFTRPIAKARAFFI